MKSKESPSLYEILRTASRPSAGGGTAAKAPPERPAKAAVVEEAPKQSLKERLAAYKAAKLGTAPPPAPAPRPMLTPVPRPTPSGGAKPAGPGERVIRLTYNTAAFLALVAVGLVFIAYSVGVRSGRASAEAPGTPDVQAPAPVAATPAPAPSVPAPAPAPAPPERVFSIHLIEWEAPTAQKRLDAQRYAGKFKQVLEAAGHTGVKPMLVKKNGKEYVALYIGEFTSRSSQEAKAMLAAVQKVQYNGRSYFSRAGFEEITPR